MKAKSSIIGLLSLTLLNCGGSDEEIGATATAAPAATVSAGASIVSNRKIASHASNLCTQYSGEACFFNGGQVVKFSDDTALVLGGITFMYVSPGSDFDTDSDQHSITALIPPGVSSTMKLSAFVARGSGYKTLWLAYDRAGDKLSLVYDSNGNLSADDGVLVSLTLTDW